MKPIRVRKARRSGPCPICRHLVLVGQLIVSVRGPWHCLSRVTSQQIGGPPPTRHRKGQDHERSRPPTGGPG
jgi:hypothetical protein